MLPKILLVTLGGTIAMTPGSGTGLTPTLCASELLSAVPALAKIAKIEAVSPSNIPSASLTIAQVRQTAHLLNERLAGDIAGVVVVQGTDTIEETAFLFDQLIDSDKPVVVVGAMRSPQSPGADGPANLLAGVITAASPVASGLGTLVVLNDTIHAARFVQKSSTFLPSAFYSPGAGPLGFVAEGNVHIVTRVKRSEPIRSNKTDVDHPVALITVSLGDDGRMLHGLYDLGYRGAVIEAMGAGHVPASLAPILGTLAQAMLVVLSSRTGSGPVFGNTYGFDGSETDLLQRGLINGGALCGLKARLLLSLLLSSGYSSSEINSVFSRYDN